MGIKVNAQRRDFFYYTITDSLVYEKIQYKIETNSFENAPVTYVECHVKKKKAGLLLLLKFEYFHKILDMEKVYGFTIVNKIPVFLCGKKTKTLFKKTHKKGIYNIYSSEEYQHILIEDRACYIYYIYHCADNLSIND